MTHPATVRAATQFVEALGARVDIGLVFPPRDGEMRGRGVWYAHDVKGSREVPPLLARAAAANMAGAAVYVRVHATDLDPKALHPGVVLIDDLDAVGVQMLEDDGLPASVVVETSPSNFQAWVRLAADGQMSRHEAIAGARELASRYGGDPKAVSATQPGRLPGFTNRKPKYQRSDGTFPFVRLQAANPRVIGSGAAALLREVRRNTPPTAQPARAYGGAPKTPQAANEDSEWATLDAIRLAQKARIDAEVASGRRPVTSGTASEVDFAATVGALMDGVAASAIEAWLRARRSGHHETYAARTVENASRYMTDREGAGHDIPAARAS